MEAPSTVEELLVACATIAVFGAVLSFLFTRSPVASLTAALLKAALFLFYYHSVFDGTFTFLDDWAYLRGGETLLGDGVRVFNMLAHVRELFQAGRGLHFTYYLYNAEAIALFGHAYWAPVGLNICLTFVAAGFIMRVLEQGLGASRAVSRGAFFFVALHPDILVWSTIMNGKDVLVMTLIGAFTYAVSCGSQQRTRYAVLVGGSACALLLFTRYYVPLMLLAALVIALVVSRGGHRRFAMNLAVLGGIAVVVTTIGIATFSDIVRLFREDFVNPIYGLVRFALTPIPFNASREYAFLNLPQVFHWLMFPFLICGIIEIWRQKSLTGRFLTIYFFLAVVLYASYGELQGPRHRVQIDGAIAIYQFFGIVAALRAIASSAYRIVRPAAQSR